ncbi:MAG: hypothetical protein JXO49_01480 [Deltaproteobacteria bacterium]|nr:hypothetical protein [Candidatus Anaeroferrophillus wilburensis]MBN2887999.1 hypothetical protein [Deltaproteobacteria bacterium]
MGCERRRRQENIRRTGSVLQFLAALRLLLILFLLFSVGCSLEAIVEDAPTLGTKGRVFVYLQPLPQESRSLTFVLEQLAAVSEDGSLKPLESSSLEIKGDAFSGRQKLLTAAILPSGSYQGLSLVIAAATISGEEGETNLLVPEQPLLISQKFHLLPGNDQALFLTLLPENLVAQGYRFSPSFSLGVPRRLTRNFTGFASQTATHTVTVFNKRTMEVFCLLSPGTTPRGMALDDRSGRLYVALAGDDAVAVIDVDTLEEVGRVGLFFGDRPVELALAVNGDTLVAANQGSRTLSIIDTASLYERHRVQLNSEPAWVVADRSGRQVYVLQAMDNSVAIIDLASGVQLTTIVLDEVPEHGALSRDGNQLYVVGRRSGDLLVVDLQQLAVVDKIFVGGGSSAITADSRTNLVYIGKQSGEVVLVDAAAQMVLDSCMVPGDVRHLAIDGEENSLFILSAGERLIHKVDLVGKQGLGRVETAEGGYSLVIMGAR